MAKTKSKPKKNAGAKKIKNSTHPELRVAEKSDFAGVFGKHGKYHFNKRVVHPPHHYYHHHRRGHPLHHHHHHHGRTGSGRNGNYRDATSNPNNPPSTYSAPAATLGSGSGYVPLYGYVSHGPSSASNQPPPVDQGREAPSESRPAEVTEEEKVLYSNLDTPLTVYEYQLQLYLQIQDQQTDPQINHTSSLPDKEKENKPVQTPFTPTDNNNNGSSSGISITNQPSSHDTVTKPGKGSNHNDTTKYHD